MCSKYSENAKGGSSMKKIMCSFISLLLLSGIAVSPIKANDSDPENEKPKVCGVHENITLVETIYNENGEQVDIFSDNSRTIYRNDGGITILVPADPIEGADAILGATRGTNRIGWVVIGKVIIKILAAVGYVQAACEVISWFDGDRNPCDIVKEYIRNFPDRPEITYEVTGLYHLEYIPGCEPAHSWGCNASYWEYDVREA